MLVTLGAMEISYMAGYAFARIRFSFANAIFMIVPIGLLNMAVVTIVPFQMNGRAIVRDPQVFLFDEPLSNLDAKLCVVMHGKIKSLHQRLKTATIYVTHDQVEVMMMADAESGDRLSRSSRCRSISRPS